MTATHFHLLANHLPIVMLCIAFGLFVYSFFARMWDARRIALALFVGSAITLVPVYFTGEDAEHYVEEAISEVSHKQIHEHEESAEVSFILVLVLGLFSLVHLIWKPLHPIWTILLLVISIVSLVSVLHTGYEGGRIRHTEVYLHNH